MLAALALASLAVVGAAPVPPTKQYFHPSADPVLCLSGADGDGASVNGCGIDWGFQDFVFTGGQLKLTSGGYDLCLAPDAARNGASVVGHPCAAGEHASWVQGPRPGTVAWKGFCLDNAFGKAEEGNPVQVWKCSTYNNKNQVWNLSPAPEF